MKKIILIFPLILFSIATMAAETQVIVRVKAKDAKFVGSSLGGAYVIIRNTLTNEILAQGKTEGSTGNTDLIMRTDKKRGMQIADENTAKFLAKIDIDEPTFVRIEARSPLNKKQAQAVVTTELWLIPEKHILGDGIVLEVSGFVIDILSPRTHHYMALEDVKKQPFVIQANMVMMCGCTIKNGGLWNAEEIEVKALIKKNGVLITELTMQSPSVNLFEGSFDLKEAGQYEVIVYAYDGKTGNTGVDKVNYVVYE